MSYDSTTDCAVVDFGVKYVPAEMQCNWLVYQINIKLFNK